MHHNYRGSIPKEKNIASSVKEENEPAEEDWVQGLEEVKQRQETEQALEQVCIQIGIVEQSKHYINQIIFGILLSQHVLSVQRCQLITQRDALCEMLNQGTSSNTTGASNNTRNQETVECKLFQFRLASNLLVLIALKYFYQLSVQACQTPTTDCNQQRANFINNKASSLTLFASLLRLTDLICEKNSKTEVTVSEKV